MSVFRPPHLNDTQRWRGLRVGLLGGSFNPAHEGHVHISLAALNGLKLDFVWWLVTPQNPIKEQSPAPLDERVKLSRKIIENPRILVTDMETELGTNITYETIKALKRRFIGTEFVWISGMDNALNLHKWNHWQDLLRQIPMVHLSRNPANTMIKACPLRMYTPQKHVFLNKGAKVPLDSGTTYWLMQKKIVHTSSSEIRKNNGKS
ncbi:nicotinate-nicotinamide nucleotide adenylyltransferase [Alphaproteobacteria bacterium]|nr:nicotinate-nicotinamide nucleotide adenylyltransferase [Alphaproteobacteria bacterium]